MTAGYSAVLLLFYCLFWTHAVANACRLTDVTVEHVQKIRATRADCEGLLQRAVIDQMRIQVINRLWLQVDSTSRRSWASN